MEIEFIIEEDSLEKLIQKYINEKTEQRLRTLLNSILVIVSQKGLTVQAFLNQLKIFISSKNDNQKQKAVQLFSEVLKRKKDFHQRQQEALNTLKYITQKILDLSTTAECIKITFQLLNLTYNQDTFNVIIELFGNPKFHPSSHKQITRNYTYRILQFIAEQKKYLTNTSIKTKFLRIIFDATYQQRDPRNIIIVFRLYKWILTQIELELLVPFKQMIFQNLQQYYPIDLLGNDDNQNQNVAIEELIEILDDCLTFQLFQQKIFTLLKQKLATPPIRQFLGTLKKYITNVSQQANSKKVYEVTMRILQSDFLQDQSAYSFIISYFETYINNLNWKQHLIPYNTYEVITQILQILIQKLLTKFNGFVISIIKMMSRNKKSHIITNSFIISNIIRYYHMYNTENLRNHLGLLIVCLNSMSSSGGGINKQNKLDFETYGFLQIALNEIYKKNEEISIKILILKVFMEFNSVDNKFVLSTFIEDDILKQIKNQKNQLLIRKSLLDFIITIKNNDKLIRETQTYFKNVVYNNNKSNQLIKQQQQQQNQKPQQIKNQISYENIEMIIYYFLQSGNSNGNGNGNGRNNNNSKNKKQKSQNSQNNNNTLLQLTKILIDLIQQQQQQQQYSIINSKSLQQKQELQKYIDNVLQQNITNLHKRYKNQSQPEKFILYFSKNYEFFKLLSIDSLKKMKVFIKEDSESFDQIIESEQNNTNSQTLKKYIIQALNLKQGNYLQYLFVFASVIKTDKIEFISYLQNILTTLHETYSIESPSQNIQKLLVEQILSFYLPKQSENIHHYTEVIRLSKIRNLNKSQMVKIKQQIINNTASHTFLINLFQRHPNEMPSFRHYLFNEIFNILEKKLLKKQNKEQTQQLFFILLNSTPIELLEKYSMTNIIEIILKELTEISENQNILALSLKILNMNFTKIDKKRVQTILVPFIFKKIEKNQNQHTATTLVLFCQMLAHISEVQNMIKFKKQTIKLLQKYLMHKKRKVRQSVVYTINKWYNL